VHSEEADHAARRRPGEVAGDDVAVDEGQLALDILARGVEVLVVLRAAAELEVRAQALQAQDRLGVARIAVCAL
jgi:hypothetical protein